MSSRYSMTPFRLPDILSRVADLAGAKTDSALAGELGVTRQTLATWKNRGKVPYEELCEFAGRHGVSLDFLLLGKKETKTGIDLALFKEVRQALRSELSEMRELDDEEFGTYTVTIYNEVSSIDDPGLRQRMIIGFVAIASRERLKEFVRLSEWLIPRWETLPSELRQFPGFSNVENLTKGDLQKERDSAMRRLEDLDTFLKSLSAQGVNATQKDSAATEPEASHVVNPSRQKSTEDRGHKVAASRGTVREGGKKKKKK